VKRFCNAAATLPQQIGDLDVVLNDVRSTLTNGRHRTPTPGPKSARSGPDDPSSAPMASTEPNATTVIVLPLFQMTP
jgi:hypothetical protein